MRSIVKAVADYYEVNPYALTSHRREAYVTRARHVAFYLCRHFGASYYAIARHFGRDHSTVIAGVRRVETDDTLKAFAGDVLAKIEKRKADRRWWDGVVIDWEAA
jgi:chromosomal replication initiator protein